MSHFFNREISWLKFNERVLEEAEDQTNPLLERLKFLSIFMSNLDEFFMIRVAGVNEQISAQITERTADNLNPNEQLQAIYQHIEPLQKRHGHVLSQVIIPQLAEKEIFFRKYADLNTSQQSFLLHFFNDKLFPILTPLAVDSSHPTPQLRSLFINLLVELKSPLQPNTPKLAFVPVPNVLPRFIIFNNDKNYEIILLEDIVAAHLPYLFPNLELVSVSYFRLTRNADLQIAEEEADDLLKLIERELRKRRLGTIIRMEVGPGMSPNLVQFLKEEFELDDTDIYHYDGYLAVNQFMQLMSLIDRADLKDSPFTAALHPVVIKSRDIFEAIKQQDILLIQPYDSFNPVIELLKSAAIDPNVLAIKQTLYRTSGKSPIVAALKEAAERGKEVTALIELKARFDEENNISWAKELEKSGVNVVYGMVGLKVHCKVCLILRNENEHIQTYLHLGTGNYNERTAGIYTDISLFTADRELGADIAELFNVLTGFSLQTKWRHIWVSPITLRDNCVRLIYQCIEHHTAEQPASIQIIMNSLVDPDMIELLYKASQVGVKIELIVRGICCLVPGLAGVSENITVRSIVGRFLEHARILHFHFNGASYLYAGSADWMQRNLNRRVEVMFPIRDALAQRALLDYLQVMFSDNLKSRFLDSTGAYRKASLENLEDQFSAQHYMMELAKSKQQAIDTTLNL
jgi:polyphosphate kinase